MSEQPAERIYSDTDKAWYVREDIALQMRAHLDDERKRLRGDVTRLKRRLLKALHYVRDLRQMELHGDAGLGEFIEGLLTGESQAALPEGTLWALEADVDWSVA